MSQYLVMRRGLGRRQIEMLRTLATLQATCPEAPTVPMAEVINRICGSVGKPLPKAARGPPRVRASAEAEYALNPTRVIDSLVRRGFVKRSRTARGHIGITDAGRLALVNWGGLDCRP